MAVVTTSPAAPLTSPTFITSILGSFGGTSLFKAGATSNYNVVSLNNDITLAGVTGIFGGASGDTGKLYLAALSSVAIRINNVDVCLTTGAVFSPAANDSCALGSTSLKWSDHFKATGHVDNWNSGNVTLTHSTNTLTLGPAASILALAGTTAASSTATGALTVAGGIGVAGAGFFGSLTVNATAAGANVVTLGSARVLDYGVVQVSANPSGGGDGYTLGEFRTLSSLVSGSVIVGRFEFSKSGAGTDNKTKFRIAVHDGSALNDVLNIPETGSVILGTGARATNATDGFVYIPTCAGTPTGTPTAVSGRVAMIYDTTNNKFYIYNGAWKGGTAPGAWT